STPSPQAAAAVPALDVDVNELALVYRARGESEAAARAHADRILRDGQSVTASVPAQHEAVGSASSAALSSFLFFGSGALLPVIPFLFGMAGIAAVVVAAVLVGIALLLTGATVGVLSGASPLRRALRQLAIGYGAAAVTYLIGLLFGTTLL
ncbi:MAG: VIT1/CCC1 transporter family protein, partial [Actinomycetota bacterium]|nr:VIT1/CCC1 transporter family protein [Actinomycetota bacterium]